MARRSATRLTVTPVAAAKVTDSAALVNGAGVRQRTEYDVMDRRTTALGPAIIHVAGAEAWVPKPSAAEQLVVTTTVNWRQTSDSRTMSSSALVEIVLTGASRKLRTDWREPSSMVNSTFLGA